MSAIEVRPFRRGDRDQLTKLVNAHAGAVVPGMSVSVHTVLSQLEREPGEFITDPWVSDRATLVAEQGGRVAAAAHLLRYFSDDRRSLPGRVSSAPSTGVRCRLAICFKRRVLRRRRPCRRSSLI